MPQNEPTPDEQFRAEMESPDQCNCPRCVIRRQLLAAGAIGPDDEIEIAGTHIYAKTEIQPVRIVRFPITAAAFRWVALDNLCLALHGAFRDDWVAAGANAVLALAAYVAVLAAKRYESYCNTEGRNVSSE